MAKQKTESEMEVDAAADAIRDQWNKSGLANFGLGTIARDFASAAIEAADKIRAINKRAIHQ